jgi:hypothetical protein
MLALGGDRPASRTRRRELSGRRAPPASAAIAALTPSGVASGTEAKTPKTIARQVTPRWKESMSHALLWAWMQTAIASSS